MTDRPDPANETMNRIIRSALSHRWPPEPEREPTPPRRPDLGQGNRGTPPRAPEPDMNDLIHAAFGLRRRDLDYYAREAAADAEAQRGH